jgi:apoptosis-inducing factor 2
VRVIRPAAARSDKRSDTDRDMAGIARKQAATVAHTIGALIAGRDELERYERFPPAIAVPLGPEGGAG